MMSAAPSSCFLPATYSIQIYFRPFAGGWIRGRFWCGRGLLFGLFLGWGFFLRFGCRLLFRFRLRLCFRLRCGGFQVGCWRSACGGEQEQWDDAGGCDGSGLGHGRLPSLVLFSSLVGAWFWVRFSKKILLVLCNLLVYNLHLI